MTDDKYMYIILIYWNTLIKSDATCANEIWLGEFLHFGSVFFFWFCYRILYK